MDIQASNLEQLPKETDVFAEVTEELPDSPSDPNMDIVDEAEMANMVPIQIRSDAPELQEQVGTQILACKDLDWGEFLKMFVDGPHSDYIIKGGGGTRVLDFDSKIGDYINGFKRCNKVYPIHIDKVRKPRPGSKALRPVGRPPGLGTGRRRRRRGEAVVLNHNSDSKQNLSSSVSNSTEENICSQISNELDEPMPCSLDGDLEMDEWGDPIENKSTMPNADRRRSKMAKSQIETLDSSQSSTTSRSSLIAVSQQSTGEFEAEPQFPQFLKPAAKNRGKSIHPTLNKANNGPPKESRIQPCPQNDIGYNSSDDESIILRNPSRANKAPDPELKDLLLYFLLNKVSNRDMLKVREELMKLKDKDDYFKLTSLAPLTAGLLEQMVCRNVPSSS